MPGPPRPSAPLTPIVVESPAEKTPAGDLAAQQWHAQRLHALRFLHGLLNVIGLIVVLGGWLPVALLRFRMTELKESLEGVPTIADAALLGLVMIVAGQVIGVQVAVREAAWFQNRPR